MDQHRRFLDVLDDRTSDLFLLFVETHRAQRRNRTARGLGINTDQLRMFVFTVSSVLVASAVAFIGTVAFVGLISPHCAKLLLGEDQRFFDYRILHGRKRAYACRIDHFKLMSEGRRSLWEL